MHLPVSHQALLGDFEDDCEEPHARMADSGSGGEGSPVSRGSGGCIRDRPVKVIPCPRCQSMNTKFCYYNNYSVTQPRHFCRNCQRYWTVGGTLRNVPVGGGSRKKTRTRNRNDTYLRTGTHGTSPVGSLSSPIHQDGLLSASNCMQQLSMLPSASRVGFGNQLSGFGSTGSQIPVLQFAQEQNQGIYPQVKPLAGIQEVPDLQLLYEVQQPVNSGLLGVSSAMLNNGYYLSEVQPSHSEALASVMQKYGLWSNPAQQLQSLAGPQTQVAWDGRQCKPALNSQLQQLTSYEEKRNPMNASVLPQKTGFWETALMHSRPLMNDRMVPHTWDENQSAHPTLSPHGSSTSEEERMAPNNSFTHGYGDAVPWVGLHASDILFQ